MGKTKAASEPTEQKPAVVSIKNVKAIEYCDIPIPEDGGVVIMRGSNGAGKSTAIACVDAILTGDTSGIELRDGEIKGSVEGFGVKIHVGRSKVQRTGKLETIGLEHSIDLATFISPKRQDEKTADKDRIRELVSISGMKTDPSLFYPLFGGEQGFEFSIDEDDIHGKDMIELSGVVKRTLQKQASEAEKKATELKGKADALKTVDKSVDLSGETDAAKLEAERDQAMRNLSSIESRAESARKQAERVHKAEAKLNELQATAYTPTEDLKSKQADIENSIRGFIERRIEAERELVKIAEFIKQAEAKANQNAETIADAERRDKERQTLLELIKSDFELSPTAEQIEQAKKRLADAKKAVTDGALIRDAIQKREQAKEVEKRIDGLTLDAKELRERATMVDSIVSKAIKAPGLLIEDGRLVVVTPKRGKVYYHDLSDGERTRIALELGVLRVGERGLLALQQHFWEGLDGTAQAQVYREAKRLGVVVITAKSSEEIGDNPITAEVFQPKVAA